MHFSSAAIELEEGDNLDLLCRAAGDPEPTVTWVKISATGEEVRFSGTREVFLTIVSMSTESAGGWECRATNNAGSYGNLYF